MKALVWTGPEKLETWERPVPVPERGQVLIRSRAAGLCGTDVHLFKGAFAPAVPPLIPGHDAAGVVAAVHEDDAMPFRVGDRVVVNPNVGCGRCRYCLLARAHHCPDRRIIGLAGWDGDSPSICWRPARMCSFAECRLVARCRRHGQSGQCDPRPGSSTRTDGRDGGGVRMRRLGIVFHPVVPIAWRISRHRGRQAGRPLGMGRALRR